MKRELAEKYFTEGYNCAQSIALAFADEIALDKNVILKTISPFGGGMGRLREVCGAVSGMFYVLGALYGYDDPTDGVVKMTLYGEVQKLALEFKNRNGSYVCRDLLKIQGSSVPVPDARTAEYYKKRPCVKLVGDAAEILEAYLKERGAIC